MVDGFEFYLGQIELMDKQRGPTADDYFDIETLKLKRGMG